jgi:protein TonB
VTRWLVGVPFSLALHAALGVAAIAFLRVEQTPTRLIVDLSAVVAGREDGSMRSAGAPAAPAGPRATSPSARAAEPSRALREPAAAPAPAPPMDMIASRSHVTGVSPPRRDDSVPAPAREPAPSSPPSNAPPVIALATTADGPPAGNASTQGAPPAQGTPPAGGVGSGGGAAERGVPGPGGVGTERLAALGIAGGGGLGLAGDYAAYYARLRQRIQQVLRYPAMARKRGVTGTVHLDIAIEPDGAVGPVSVITSSSHEILDRAAVEAARSVARVPFPDDLRPRALSVRLPVVFELQ